MRKMQRHHKEGIWFRSEVMINAGREYAVKLSIREIERGAFPVFDPECGAEKCFFRPTAPNVRFKAGYTSFDRGQETERSFT